jgi:arsenate reductase
MQRATSIILYGIPNCSTVKKARIWLQEHNIEFFFFDFKKNTLDRTTIENWLTQVSLDLLINRKGTTWRALSDEQKTAASNREQAISLMIASPSLIKRPVLERKFDDTALGQHIAIGFSDAQYHPYFNEQP